MSENTVTPYQGSTDGKKQQVTQMFNTISETALIPGQALFRW